jgi:hypothetical protein
MLMVSAMRGLASMQYSERDQRGYPWLFFHPSNQWKLCVLVSSLILVGSLSFFLWCIHVSNDMGGDSFAGLVFAIAATIFMFLAALSFSLRRRARRRNIGELNGVLNWHVSFGVLALIMVFLHSFGNYNPRTGTYALYGMVALVISGLVGRMLDRIMPRLISGKVSRILTAKGEDRVEVLWGELQSSRTKNKQKSRGTPSLWGKIASPISMSGIATKRRQDSLQDGWDMAYVSLEPVSKNKKSGTDLYRFAPDPRSPFAGADVFTAPEQERMDFIEEAEQALKQESIYRYVIRIWRVFHIILAVATVAVTLWHIEYAFSLIIPAVQKFGIGYLFPWP